VSLSNPSKTTILGDILATAISKTIFAAGNDDLRPVMSGVFFQFNTESLTFVATDAHKLVKYQRTDVQASQTAEFIMPKKPLNLLKGILAGSESEVTIEYNDSNANSVLIRQNWFVDSLTGNIQTMKRLFLKKIRMCLI
jgi:DNA polymerase-3 subunit beta